MAISNYTELKAAISDWLDRSDLSGNAADFITLAEARFNRLLNVVEADATFTGVVGSREVDISSISLIEPIGLFLSNNSDEDEISIATAGTIEFENISAYPSFATFDGTKIKFNCPLDAAYSIRLRYRGKFALSDASPTNDLLADHPDVYLAGSIVWGGVYIADAGKVQGFKTLLDEFIDETQNHLSQKKRGLARPSSDLVGMTKNYGFYYS